MLYLKHVEVKLPIVALKFVGANCPRITLRPLSTCVSLLAAASSCRREAGEREKKKARGRRWEGERLARKGKSVEAYPPFCKLYKMADGSEEDAT